MLQLIEMHSALNEARILGNLIIDELERISKKIDPPSGSQAYDKLFDEIFKPVGKGF